MGRSCCLLQELSGTGPIRDVIQAKRCGRSVRGHRIVDQRWIPTASVTSPTDRFKYAHDRDGNVMYKDNAVNSAFSELYHANGATAGYDSLNRLTAFQRGALNTAKDSISGTATRTQSWNLDQLGNWDGASGVTSDGTAQARTHNSRNQSTAVGSIFVICVSQNAIDDTSPSTADASRCTRRTVHACSTATSHGRRAARRSASARSS